MDSSLKITPVHSGLCEAGSGLCPEIFHLRPKGAETLSKLGDLIIPADMRNSITEGTTFAISVEPFGGSPTGQATGPVIAVGTARWG